MMINRYEKLKYLILLCLFAGFFSVSSAAARVDASPLPADDAFALSVTVNKPTEISVEWRIAPGYYLYAKRIRISLPPQTKTDIRMPQGEFRYDADRGRYEAFSGYLSIPVSLKTKDPQLSLTVNYQGCSRDGFCYPPMEKHILLNLSNYTATPIDGMKTVSFQSLMTDQQGIQNLLQTQSFPIMLLIFAGLGLLLAFTPCVLPMIPILTSIVVGQQQSTTKKAFMLSASYVLGMAITYAITGLLAAAMGSSLQVWLQQPWMIGIMSGLFVLLALSLFGFYELKVPQHWQQRIVQLSNQQQGGTYLGVFLMGVLSTLIVSPCVTAPLVGVLMYIGQTGDLILGASALFVMGLGMGVPLLLIGMSAGKWLPKSGPWMEAVKQLFGILMLGMAIWLLSRIIPLSAVMIGWGLLLLGLAWFFGIYLPRLVGRRRLNRALGLLVGFSGMLMMLGGIEPDMMNKLKLSQHTANDFSFVVVRDVSDFNKQLAAAQALQRPVILDFYADWCESCVSMERNVFGSAEVKKALANYVLLRADLSQNNAADETMMQHFNVIAPPTVLFFDHKGREADSQRIVGEINVQEFLTRLNVFIAARCDGKVKC